MSRVIFLCDLQSFYASCEKAERPELKDSPVAVAGDPERRSGIILAACPVAKAYGVKTGEVIREALAKCFDLVTIQPRMQHYIRVSLQIASIYYRFADLVEPYSIDEYFIDVTDSLLLFGCSPEQLARHIQHQVYVETGIKVRIGIGKNKVLAKSACDLFAKKNDAGIYTLRQEELPNTYWPLSIDNMFMVGSRMHARLYGMGISTIGKLAQMPLAAFQDKLGRSFRQNSDINAEVLWRIANGIDDSPVTPNTFDSEQKGIGHMMTLPWDYRTLEDIRVVLHELADMVCQRSRAKGRMGWVAAVGVQGADFDRPHGFYRQVMMPHTTNLGKELFEAVLYLYQKHWNGKPVRKLGVSLLNLVPDSEYQLSLFPGDREKQLTLAHTVDNINRRFGGTTVIRASSATPAGQARRRAGMIGGHFK